MAFHEQSNDERQPLLFKPPTCESDPPSGAVTPKHPHHPSKVELTLILLALWSAVFLGAVDTTIVATLLTSIGSDFDRAHQSSYLGSSYLLSVCCFTPLYGRLSDIIGRRAAMLLALSLFGAGTLLCGLAPSMETLIVARAIAGMGGGGMMAVSSITCTDLIPLRHRGLYQGLANVLYGFGAGLGGPLGGFINDRFGWRWAFLCQMPLWLLSFVLIAIFVNVKLPSQPETAREKFARIDYLGSLTLVVGIGGALLGVTLKGSEELPWRHPLVSGLLLLGFLFLVLFVYVESFVSREPIMPLRLLKQRTPLAVSIANLLVSATAYTALYNVPIYYTAVRSESAKTAGLHLLPNSVALAMGSVSAGLAMRWTGKFYYLILINALLVVTSSALIASWKESSSAFHMWLDIAPSGFGGSSVITTTLIALIASVKRTDVAVATGISYLFRTTGQVLGVSLSGSLLQSLLVRQLRQRITGEGAAELIQKIRHSAAIIQDLDPLTRQAAIESYAQSLRAVFFLQTAMGFLTFLACLPIQENPLPGTLAQRDEETTPCHQARDRCGE